jgi:hypothetical protein
MAEPEVFTTVRWVTDEERTLRRATAREAMHHAVDEWWDNVDARGPLTVVAELPHLHWVRNHRLQAHRLDCVGAVRDHLPNPPRERPDHG